MRVLVTGAAGMLGTSLVPSLRTNDHTVYATDINNLTSGIDFLDVRVLEEMMRVAENRKPNLLVHLAAETDLEKCETNVDYAYAENFIGTQNACMVSQTLGIPLAYVSTAGVFDGAKMSPYCEFDSPNPINVYGASKYQGEAIVRETVPNHYIVRAGWMIGGGIRDKKFVRKILDQLDAGARKIYAVDDKFGTPTYAPSFSNIFSDIIATKRYGTYHLACRGRGSRYDVANRLIEVLGRRDVTVIPVSSEYFREKYFAPRPKSEEMTNYVLDLLGMNKMPDWRDAIEMYLRSDFQGYFH